MSARLVERMMDDLRNRVRLTVGRAILSLVSDSKAIQTAQARLLAGETQDDAERIQEYGFTSVPLPGAEGVMVFVGGQRDHGLIIATDDRRYRVKGLAGGEVALYTDEDLDGGHRIHLKRGKVIELLSGPDASILQTPAKTTVTNATEIDLVSGGSSAKIKPDSITLTVGGQVLLLNSTGLFHNGKNIGSTHVHINTMPNSGTLSGVPQ